TQRLAAPDTTKTPPVVCRTDRKEHVAARPVARTQRNFFTFFGWALTLARRTLAVRRRSCAADRRRGGHGRWATAAALPITPRLLLAVLPALVARPILVLSVPASPAACRRTAGGRAVPALRMRWQEPPSTAFEETTASAASVRLG